MLNTTPSIPLLNPWPDHIKHWLADDAYHEGIEAEMRRALASDPRLAETAATLGSHTYIDDPDVPDFVEGGLHAFLRGLLGLPTVWKFRIAHPGDFVAEELDELENASDRYLRVLAKHRSLVEVYLSGWTDVSPASLESGKQRFVELQRATESIRGLSSGRQHVMASTDVPELPRKKEYEAPERGFRNFFASELAKRAKQIFGRPMYREIGLLTTVCLRLKDEMGAEEVRNVAREARANIPKTSTESGPKQSG